MARYSFDGADGQNLYRGRSRSRSPARERRERSPSPMSEESNDSGEDQQTETDNSNGIQNHTGGNSSGAGSEWYFDFFGYRQGLQQNQDRTVRRRTENVNSTRDGLAVTLTDPDVLDCAVCYEPLDPPVYQCDNGHIACSSCCLKMTNKCPFCQMPIGYSRCRAIEKVLQSITLSCKNAVYGCQEVLCYSKKSVHEKTCIYAPFKCPFPDCGFFDSHDQFKLHLINVHETTMMLFLYDSVNRIYLNKTVKFLILQEETEGNLFLLSSSALNSGSTHVGNVLALNSFGSSLSDKEFYYNLCVSSKTNCIEVISRTHRIVDSFDGSSVMGHLFVPTDCFDSEGILLVKLTIYQDSTSYLHI